MKTLSKNFHPRLLTMLGAWMPWCIAAWGDAVPEPGLVMYGSITNASGAQPTRVTSGRLTWTIQAVGSGSAVTLSADVTDINGQVCYILHVPFGSSHLQELGIGHV